MSFVCAMHAQGVPNRLLDARCRRDEAQPCAVALCDGRAEFRGICRSCRRQWASGKQPPLQVPEHQDYTAARGHHREPSILLRLPEAWASARHVYVVDSPTRVRVGREAVPGALKRKVVKQPRNTSPQVRLSLECLDVEEGEAVRAERDGTAWMIVRTCSLCRS
jgi:hypothetical protein